MFTVDLEILPIKILKPHEGVDFKLVEELAANIRETGVLRKAVAIDQDSKVILNGHHRVKALEALGCKFVPCILLDYSSQSIIVLSWSKGMPLPKTLIINSGLKGRLLPPKTSKHMVSMGGRLIPLSELEPEVNMSIYTLITGAKGDAYVNRRV